MTNSREKVEDIVVVPLEAEIRLNQRQLEDYRQSRERSIKWECNLGKNGSRLLPDEEVPERVLALKDLDVSVFGLESE